MRIAVAGVLVVLLSVGTLRNLTVIAALLVQQGLSAYTLGVIVGALVPAIGVALSIRSLRRGLARRREWVAVQRVFTETPDERRIRWAAAEEEVYRRRPVTWEDKEIDLQRDYPEDDWWTAQPLDEVRVAEWLTEHGFAMTTGEVITPAHLREGDGDPFGNVHQLVHVDPHVWAAAGVHGGRLRSLGLELHTDDRSTRVRLVDAMHALAAEQSTVLHSER